MFISNSSTHWYPATWKSYILRKKLYLALGSTWLCINATQLVRKAFLFLGGTPFTVDLIKSFLPVWVTSLSKFFILAFKGFLYNYKRKVFIKGMGFKFILKNKLIIIKVGLSHNLYTSIPSSISVFATRKERLIMHSRYKQILGLFTKALVQKWDTNLYTLKGIYLFKAKMKKKPGKVALY